MVIAVTETIGSREKYINIVKEHIFSKEEKDTLLQASITVLKKEPNQEIIRDAYDILLDSGAIVEPSDYKLEKENIDEQVDKKDDLKSKNIDQPVDTKVTFREKNIDKNPNMGHKSKKKYWKWSAFAYILILFLSAVIGHGIRSILEFITLTVPFLVLIFTVIFIRNLIRKADNKTIEKPVGIKITQFFLSFSFIFGVLVGLYTILNMIFHEGSSYLTSSVFAYIGFFIAAGIVLSWYVIKAISNGVRWVKTVYLIFVFISLFTFFPSYESIGWMKQIYKFNFVMQEIFAIFASLGLLLPSSSDWFQSIPIDSKASTIYNSALQAIKKTPHSESSISYIDEIKKLGELKEDGLLTEEEFLQQKQKLLNKE